MFVHALFMYNRAWFPYNHSFDLLFSYNYIKKKVWDGRLLSPLFDTQKYTRDLESLFYRIWRRYEKGLPVDHTSLD